MQIKLLGDMGDEKWVRKFPALYEFLWQTIIADFECSNEVTKTKNQFGF